MSAPVENMAGTAASAQPSKGYWGLVWVQFRKRRDAYYGLYLLAGLFGIALCAPLLSNNLPLWYSGAEGSSSPLLRDFLFPLSHLDRFYNCLLLTLLAGAAGGPLLLHKRASGPVLRGGSFALLLAGMLLGCFGLSYLVGGKSDRTRYKDLKDSGKAEVRFTLHRRGALEDDPARTDHHPGRFIRLSLSIKGGSLDGTVAEASNAQHQLPLLLGRSTEARITFDTADQAHVDKRHAELYEADDELRIRSLSAMGTWLDGKPVPDTGAPVNHGSVIRLGAQGPEITVQMRAEYHPLGCDNSGFDVLARIIHGSRISLAVGFLAMGLALSIGVIVGSMAGYFGGWVDLLVSRVIEIFICFPSFFLILTIIAVAPSRSIFWVMFAIGLVGWMGVARLVRGEVLKVRQLDYIQAARALGAPDRRIIARHILPNALAPVLVAATFGVAGAILSEAGLGFLGLGVEPPTPSWGELLNQARQDPVRLWWLMSFPGFMIFASVTLMNLVGEGLRDAMDPRLRR